MLNKRGVYLLLLFFFFSFFFLYFFFFFFFFFDECNLMTKMIFDIGISILQGVTNKYASDTGYKCLQCAPGCDTCMDSSPCILELNWVQRSIVLGLSCFVMAFIPMLVWFTFRYSQVKVLSFFILTS